MLLVEGEAVGIPGLSSHLASLLDELEKRQANGCLEQEVVCVPDEHPSFKPASGPVIEGAAQLPAASATGIVPPSQPHAPLAMLAPLAPPLLAQLPLPTSPQAQLPLSALSMPPPGTLAAPSAPLPMQLQAQQASVDYTHIYGSLQHQAAVVQQQQQAHQQLLAMQAMASASQDSWSQSTLSSCEGVSDFLVNEDDTAKAEPDTHIGVIARFDDKHGYGFIKCSTTWPRFSRDVFLHRMYFRHLVVGDIVSFQLLVNDRGQPQARRIRKLEGQAARHVESQLTSLGSIDQVYYIGLVARFDMDKGYGFLACDATKLKYGRDVFLRKVLYVEVGLQVGDAVHFQVELNEKGFPQARNIMKMNQQSAEALALAAHLAVQPVQTSTVPPPSAASNQEALPAQRFTGRVLSFDEKAGYGFVQSQEVHRLYGQDVFLHRRECGVVELAAGDAVSFRVEVTDKGLSGWQLEKISPDQLAPQVRLPPGALEYAGVMAAEHAKRQKTSF